MSRNFDQHLNMARKVKVGCAYRVAAKLTFGVVAILSAFSTRAESCQMPERPSSVPSDAVWAGGSDGGSWVLCSPIAREGSFRCKIFDDYLGHLITDAIFHLYFLEADGKLSRAENARLVHIEPRFYDGAIIALQDNLVLSPESKAHQREK
jgi:hypothetical protein